MLEGFREGNTRIVLTLALAGTAALAPAQAQQFEISTYAGGSATIPVVGTAIGSPLGVTTDSAGTVYFISLDYGVFKLDRSGVLTRIAGNGVGYSGDGGLAMNAQFSFGGGPDEYYAGTPGVAVDSAGNVYIADSGNHRVRKISTGGIITTVAGNGTPGFSGDGGAATGAQLNYPSSLAVDRSGNLYIGSGDRIRKVSPDGNITTATAATVGSPIAIDGAGDLYIGSGGEIRTIAPNGVVTNVAGGDGYAMTVDNAGNIYVVEDGLVRKITRRGTSATIAGGGIGYGPCGSSGDGGSAVSAQVCATALAVDNEGSLYITEAANQRVRKVSVAGAISTVAGISSCCYSGDGGPASAALLNFGPWGGGMAVDSGGNVYIADSGNGRVRKISGSGTITTVAGNGVQGFSGDGGPATSAQLNYPSGVAVDSGGNLYIEDAGNHRIRKVSPNGTITTAVTQAGGRALAVDKADNVYYFPDGGGIGKITPSGIIVTVTNAQLNLPFALAADTTGALYFAEIGYVAGVPNYRVRKLSPDGNITLIAGGDGTPGYSGDGGPATSARLNGPVGLALDSSGNLYVADTLNGCIRMVSSSGIITTLSVSGDSGPATQSGFVSGLTIDNDGNLYAADSNLIRRLKPVRSAPIVVRGVVNAASSLPGAIAPGELVAITGSGLGPAQLVSATPGSDGSYSSQLAGTTVLVNGTPALLIYTSAAQVAAVVPDSISGGTAQVTVSYQGHASASFTVPVAPAAPGIFTQDSTGQGHAATINRDGSIDTAADWEGDDVTLFVTGIGQATLPITIHGFNLPMFPESVAKGSVPGVMQIKVRIPFGQDCDTPVVVQAGDASSQPGVSIAIDLCI